MDTITMLKITSVQSNILLALARYKFLTASQLHVLQVGKDIGWIRVQAKELTEGSNALIERITFNILPRQGRLEGVFYLSKKGKDTLMQDMNIHETEIKIPIGNSSLFYKDYTHRKNTIDFQISLYQWSEQQEESTHIDFFDCYFDKIGNNRTNANLQAKNKILIGNDDYIIPDAVFRIDTPPRPYLFLFEMYDGKDTKRVLEQVKKHVRAIALGSPSEKYTYAFTHRVILLFEHETMKNAFLERTKNEPYFSEVAVCFRCKSIAGVQTDFFRGWENLKGESGGLF
jgi:hypothetical protein